MNARWILALTVVMISSAVQLQAEDWPQFRGITGSVPPQAEDKLPSEWNKDKNIAWKISVPGYAWSCPIVWGDKIFLTTAVSDKAVKPKPGMGGMGGGGMGGGGRFGPGGRPGGGGPGGGRGGKAPDAVYKWEVYCLNASDGKILWKQTAAEKKPTNPIHSTNTYATETPVTDGERVYAFFGAAGLYCFDMKGKQLWDKNLGTFRISAGFGTSSSPVLADGKLFVQCDNEENSFLLALDGKTGKEIWKIDRPDRTSWSSPFVWKNKYRTELVVLGSKSVKGYDPATGKVLWELKSQSEGYKASPTADEERVYFGNSGRMSPGVLFAVKANAKGDITPKEGETSSAGVAWMVEKTGPNMASPLVYRGHLYVLERGGLSCYDAATGKPVYQRERLNGAGGFTSSPWAYDGKVFCLDENGQTFVVDAGDKFKVLGKNKIDEMFWSTPAVAGGVLYLRGLEHLYAIKK